MIHLDVPQGERAWVESRLGIPTASEFYRILTPSTLKLSASRLKYKGQLLVEWHTGEPFSEFDNEWTEWGRNMEGAARKAYRFHTDERAGKCGVFFKDDSRMVAASPDGVVGDEGLLELKCPSPEIHLLYLATGGVPTDYRMQVQGQLWVTGREWCDFMSYHDDYPPLIVRAHPDPATQAALDEHVPAFVKEIVEGRMWLSEQGVTGWRDAA